jgi:hypothetical protein
VCRYPGCGKEYVNLDGYRRHANNSGHGYLNPRKAGASTAQGSAAPDEYTVSETMMGPAMMAVRAPQPPSAQLRTEVQMEESDGTNLVAKAEAELRAAMAAGDPVRIKAAIARASATLAKMAARGSHEVAQHQVSQHQVGADGQHMPEIAYPMAYPMAYPSELESAWHHYGPGMMSVPEGCGIMD